MGAQKHDFSKLIQGTNKGSRTFGCVVMDWSVGDDNKSILLVIHVGGNMVASNKFTPSNTNWTPGTVIQANCKLEDPKFTAQFATGDQLQDLRASFNYCNYDFINDKWLCTPFSGAIYTSSD